VTPEAVEPPEPTKQKDQNDKLVTREGTESSQPTDVEGQNELVMPDAVDGLGELLTPGAVDPPEVIKEKSHSIGKTFGLVAILSVLSKVVGLARDMVVASAYGVSVVADAYNFAYLFTGNILILFGGLGGPFHSATVSVINARKSDRELGPLILQMMMITLVVLSLITVAGYFAAPYLVVALKQVYAQMSSLQIKDQFEQQTLIQLRIMMPLIIISGLVGISYGVLNVYNKIVTPSLSPAIASLAIIGAVAISQLQYGTPTGTALAVGTLVGAIGQLLIQFPSMAKLHLRWHLTFKPQPGLSEYSKMLWPAAFSTSIGQLTVYVDAFFALQEQAVWTAIVNSNRLVQLPLGILLTAMLVPILPRFTEQVNENRIDDLKEELQRALRFLWFLALPISAILLAIPRQLVELLFMRGKFDEAAAQLVTSALVFLVPSIFFYVARDLMTRVFYAYKDTQTPYRIAILAIFMKAGLDWSLVQVMERTAAISLATSIMTVFNLSLLTWALRQKTGSLGLMKLAKPLSIMFAGTGLCGAVTWASYFGLEQIAISNTFWLRLIYVSISSAIGLTLYVALCVLFKLEEPVAVAKRLPLLKKFV